MAIQAIVGATHLIGESVQIQLCDRNLKVSVPCVPETFHARFPVSVKC